jgi:hypothetical protein
MRAFRMGSLPVVLLACAIGAAPLAAVRPASAQDARGAALEQEMRTRRLSKVKFEGTKLEDVVQWLRIATGWNYVVKKDVLAKANIDLDTITVTVELSDVTVATFLEIALEGHGLVAKPNGNIVYVTTKADAQGKPVYVLYPICHLTWTKTDFHGPDIDLHPSGFTPVDEYQPEVPVEDDPFTDPQKIVDMVKEMVDEAWDTEGWSITATKTFLMVKAPRAVQRRVAATLEVLASMK